VKGADSEMRLRCTGSGFRSGSLKPGSAPEDERSERVDHRGSRRAFVSAFFERADAGSLVNATYTIESGSHRHTDKFAAASSVILTPEPHGTHPPHLSLFLPLLRRPRNRKRSGRSRPSAMSTRNSLSGPAREQVRNYFNAPPRAVSARAARDRARPGQRPARRAPPRPREMLFLREASWKSPSRARVPPDAGQRRLRRVQRDARLANVGDTRARYSSSQWDADMRYAAWLWFWPRLDR